MVYLLKNNHFAHVFDNRINLILKSTYEIVDLLIAKYLLLATSHDKSRISLFQKFRLFRVALANYRSYYLYSTNVCQSRYTLAGFVNSNPVVSRAEH